MAVVAQRAHQLVQRERASLTAGAGNQAGSVDERGVGDRAQAIHQRTRVASQIARAERQPPLQRVQAHQRVEVVLARPAKLHVGALRGGSVPVVDHRQHALGPRTVGEPEPLEQSRMSGLGVLAPDHDQARPIAKLAERCRRGAAQWHGRRAGPAAGHRPGGDQGTEPVGQCHGGARILDGGAVEAVHEWTAGGAQEIGGAAQRGLDVDRVTVDRGRCCRRAGACAPRTTARRAGTPAAAVGLRSRPRRSRRRTADHSRRR